MDVGRNDSKNIFEAAMHIMMILERVNICICSEVMGLTEMAKCRVWQWVEWVQCTDLWN
jgi:hypothetical protein